MKRLILLGSICLLLLCACQNSLDYRHASLHKVGSQVLFIRNGLETGGNYAVGYANGNLRSDRITLSWNACTDRQFLSYRLFRNNSLIRNYIDADQTSFIDSVLTDNTYYNYRLVTTVESGMAVEDTILLKTPKFEPPTTLSYTYLSATSLRLTWTNNAESATSFTVEKTFTPGKIVETFTTTGTSYTDNNVQVGEAYQYRVKAASPYESTEYSSPFEFVYTYTMNAPLLLSAVQLNPGTDVRLIWRDNSTGETSFRIFRAVGVAGEFTQIDSVDANVTQYVDTNLKNIGFVYRYYIQAHNATESSVSNIVSVTILDLNFVLFNFESTDGEFTSNSVNGWEWGISANFGAHSGTRVWGAPLTGEYANNANYQLISPAVEVPANAILTFYQKYSMESNYDGGNVKISTDGGISWALLTPIGGYDIPNIYSSGEPGFSGSHFTWALETFDLAAYNGMQVKLKWTLTSDSSVVDDGWTIDDVRVGNDLDTVALW